MRLICTVGLFFFFSSLRAGDFPTQARVLGNWKALDSIKYYNQADLYDYIDGASDFYLSYQFQELWVVDFTNPFGKMVTLELYHHRDNNCAFGIYAEERPEKAILLKMGAQGYVANGAFFTIGPYYVKLFASNTSTSEDDMRDVASYLTAALGLETTLPSELQLFPETDRVLMSERFTAENFMGNPALHDIFSSDYNIDKQEFKFFVFKGDAESCQSMVSKYLAGNQVIGKPGEGLMLIEDKYNGKVLLRVTPNLICGIVNHPKPPKMGWFLNQVNTGL